MKVYDNYEISPCKRYAEPDQPGRFYFEACEPNEADVWTLYGHIGGEGVEAIGDFSTREHAQQACQRITGILFAGHDEVAARLRLMHASEKLLDALQWLLNDLEDSGEDRDPDTGIEYASVGHARNIIAEATGGVA